jgi:hypothetical protein
MLSIKKSEIKKGIFVVEFENQFELASTLLRFEEYYESPKFKGKVFTLEEYKQWYSRDRGAFTYYDDWPAFNIPSSALKPFFEGGFNPLSPAEKQLLSLFKNEKGDYYIIGIYTTGEEDLLTHELAHALFHTNPDYKKEVLAVLRGYDFTNVRKELLSMDGYCEDVLEDEVHAWVLTLSHELKTKIPKELIAKLDKIFKKYC